MKDDFFERIGLSPETARIDNDVAVPTEFSGYSSKFLRELLETIKTIKTENEKDETAKLRLMLAIVKEIESRENDNLKKEVNAAATLETKEILKNLDKGTDRD